MAYLRARFYAPDMGRFLTKDTWEGNIYEPLSFNQWNYVGANPVNYVDPSGYYWWGAGQALFDAAEERARNVNIHIRIQAMIMAERGEEHIHAEFPGALSIPVPHVDVLDSLSGEVWEIKPWDQAELAESDLIKRIASLQAARGQFLHGINPIGMPFNWDFNPLVWAPGTTFPSRILLGTDDTGWYNIYAGQTAPGVILWWKEKNRNKVPVLYPIMLPDSLTFNKRNQRTDRSEWGGSWVPQPAYTQTLTTVTGIGICAYVIKEVAEAYFCGPCFLVLP